MWFGWEGLTGVDAWSPTILEEARLIEAAGFNGMLFSEHHGVPKWPAQPLLHAYKIGMATQRIEVGPCPLLLPLYHPVHLIEQAQFIQNEIGGRLFLGVAGGFAPGDFAHFGVELKERAARMEDCLRILRLAQSGESFDFHGKVFNLKIRGCLPVPVKRIPVWGCTGVPATVRRAARLADAVVFESIRTRAEIRELRDIYLEECTAHSTTPHINFFRRIWIGKPEEGLRIMRSEVEAYAGNVAQGGTAPHLTGKSGGRSGDWRGLMIMGDVASCTEQILQWKADIGFEKMILKIPYITGAPDIGLAREQIAGIGEVIARVRG